MRSALSWLLAIGMLYLAGAIGWWVFRSRSADVAPGAPRRVLYVSLVVLAAEVVGGFLMDALT